MSRDLCDSAKRGRACIDDLCRGSDETLCGFSQSDYDEMTREYSDEEPCYDYETGALSDELADALKKEPTA